VGTVVVEESAVVSDVVVDVVGATVVVELTVVTVAVVDTTEELEELVVEDLLI
jgi:hypothetical protein